MRRFVGDLVRSQAVDPWPVVLVASELATNVVLHARTPFTVRVEVGDSVTRLEVRDGAAAIKVAREMAGVDPEGWGLRIVEHLASDWGVDYQADSKSVWVEIRNQATRQPS